MRGSRPPPTRSTRRRAIETPASAGDRRLALRQAKEGMPLRRRAASHVGPLRPIPHWLNQGLRQGSRPSCCRRGGRWSRPARATARPWSSWARAGRWRSLVRRRGRSQRHKKGCVLSPHVSPLMPKLGGRVPPFLSLSRRPSASKSVLFLDPPPRTPPYRSPLGLILYEGGVHARSGLMSRSRDMNLGSMQKPGAKCDENTVRVGCEKLVLREGSRGKELFGPLHH